MIIFLSVMVAGEIGLFMSIRMGFGGIYHLVSVALMFSGAFGAIVCHRKITDKIKRLEKEIRKR